MKKIDRLYLSRFALDPDPEAIWLEEFDFDESLESDSDRMQSQLLYDNEDEYFDVDRL